MGKTSINLTDPFGAAPHAFNVENQTTFHELTHLLAEELGITADQPVGGLFKSALQLPVIYAPRSGIFPGDLSVVDEHKNNADLSYYVFPTPAPGLRDIILANGASLGESGLVVSVEWAGSFYPVILPSQNARQDIGLAHYVFSQLKALLGLQGMPPGWRNQGWRLQDLRTGEHLEGELGGNFAEKIRSGDTLRLLRTIAPEQDGIVILTNRVDTPTEELDIKIGDELLDSIPIEDAQPVRINNCMIELLMGDITVQELDAIVNAAKPTLNGGGGVDGAIQKAAGPSLVKASAVQAPCSPGKAVLTPGFDLPSKWVIHTVGPIYQDGNHDEEKTLASAYRCSLAIAFLSKFSSIAFPAISTGAYGYPLEKAAQVTWQAIAEYLKSNEENPLKLVRVVVNDESAYDAFLLALQALA
jgi:O-acetyl-ADP-ribose deacetylase